MRKNLGKICGKRHLWRQNVDGYKMLKWVLEINNGYVYVGCTVME
jgi:hypothetical protein